MNKYFTKSFCCSSSTTFNAINKRVAYLSKLNRCSGSAVIEQALLQALFDQEERKYITERCEKELQKNTDWKIGDV